MASQPIITPDQRLRVFVSSTLQELAVERTAVRDAINQLRLSPVMFEQGARPHPPREVYRAYVEQSHVFVGVYWESYGWIGPDSGISGLADEFALAGAAGLPRLVYVKRPAPGRDPRLAALIDGLRADGDVSFREFTDATELRRIVEQDLAVLLTERFHRSAPTAPPAESAGLPTPPTRLVDREPELAAVTALLTGERVPLVTLTGTGGVGKTRLAIELAHRLRDRYADGVRYVELAAVTKPDRVGEALARALGVRSSGAGDAVDEVVTYLRPRELLLVLDNFEQVAEAAPVVARLLRSAPGVAVLATSRAPLRIAGEHAYAVPPLALPSPSADPTTVTGYGSVRLFLDRALAVNRDLPLTPDVLRQVVEICRRLDGLPLAIELAAARVRLLRPAEILDRLDQRLLLLTGGSRDAPERQRTLRATIEWSHQLLAPADQALLARLAVFAGFDLAAAEAVGGVEALEALERLVESSLVDQVPGSGRFRLLDSIREYGLGRLRASGDEPAARRAHAEHYSLLSLAAGPQLQQRAARDWLHRLDRDHDNLVMAIWWYLDHDDPTPALAMGEGIWVYWWLHGPLEEVRRITDRYYALRDRFSGAARVHAMLASGSTWLLTGDVDRGRARLEEARAAAREVGDEDSLARANGPLSMQAIRDRDYDRARELLAEVREIGVRLGHDWQVSLHHSRLAMISIAEGDHRRAADLLFDALTVAGHKEVPLASIVALYSLAMNALRLDHVELARQYLCDGLAVAHRSGDLNGPQLFLIALADLTARLGDPERAVFFASAAGSLDRPPGPSWLASYVLPWPDHVALDPARFAQAGRSGAALGIDEVVAEAQRG
ncbi:DUF4062 domain-containing protein [Asanoa sp. NPDC050611]|uniref:DUF4062 domain-containing protein n=1 Tax=Asanoa sp. NPDC050611 TaxID=3157098 RepID=UPI0033E108BD